MNRPWLVIVIPALIGICLSAFVHMWWFDLTPVEYLKFLGVSIMIILPTSAAVGFGVGFTDSFLEQRKEIKL